MVCEEGFQGEEDAATMVGQEGQLRQVAEVRRARRSAASEDDEPGVRKLASQSPNRLPRLGGSRRRNGTGVYDAEIRFFRPRFEQPEPFQEGTDLLAFELSDFASEVRDFIKLHGIEFNKWPRLPHAPSGFADRNCNYTRMRLNSRNR